MARGEILDKILKSIINIAGYQLDLRPGKVNIIALFGDDKRDMDFLKHLVENLYKAYDKEFVNKTFEHVFNALCRGEKLTVDIDNFKFEFIYLAERMTIGIANEMISQFRNTTGERDIYLHYRSPRILVDIMRYMYGLNPKEFDSSNNRAVVFYHDNGTRPVKLAYLGGEINLIYDPNINEPIQSLTNNNNPMELKPHEQRVVAEHDDLKVKAEALSKFINDENGFFPQLTEAEQIDLKGQLFFMEMYGKILQRRIDRFYEKPILQKTQGQELIGSFGTDKREVFELKLIAALMIDKTNEYGKDARRNAIVATDMEKAQMMAVKSLFAK